MKENIDISEFDSIFKQQLESAATTPPPGVWEGIASALPATTATATVVATGVKAAIWIKIGVGAVLATAIASVIYIASTDSKTSPAEKDVTTTLSPLVDKKSSNKSQSTPSNDLNIIPVENQIKKDNKDHNSKSKNVSTSEVIDNTVIEDIDPQLVEFRSNLQEIEKPLTLHTDESKVKTEEKKEVVEVPFEPKDESFVKVNKIDSSFIFIPNVVTPNGDGLNDVYLIDIRGEESVRIMIFDLGESKIFETTNKSTPWNCMRANGELYPDGTYLVKVIYKFPFSNEKTKTIPIQLIR